MAKISARGDREVSRWREPDGGAEIVLTQQGRLLRKWAKGETFNLVGRGVTAEAAARFADRRGAVRA